MRNFLLLMQITDSNFPTGAFSHSFGLETFVQHELVKDRSSFQQFLQGYIGQLCYTDGLAVKLVYDYLEKEDWANIRKVDEVLYCSASATESRLGAQRIGQQMLRLYRALYKKDSLETYAQFIKEKMCYGHSSICQALLLFELGFAKDVAIQTVMYTACSSIIQNAVRGIPLGQTDGQKMLSFAVLQCEENVEKVMQLDERMLGCSAPLLELKQMQHEQLHVRLFMS